MTWSRFPAFMTDLTRPLCCVPQNTRVAFGKMWARSAAVPGVMSPHYLDGGLRQPSVSWPEVGRRAPGFLIPALICTPTLTLHKFIFVSETHYFPSANTQTCGRPKPASASLCNRASWSVSRRQPRTVNPCPGSHELRPSQKSHHAGTAAPVNK